MFIVRRIVVVAASWTLSVAFAVAVPFTPERFARLLLAGVVIAVGVAVCASAEIIVFNNRRALLRELDRRGDLRCSAIRGVG